MFICVYIDTDIYIFNSTFRNHEITKTNKQMEKQCFVKGTENESLEEVTTFVTLESKQVHEGKITSEKWYGSLYEMPSGELGSDQKAAEHLKSQ